MITVIDYDAGNIKSVEKALQFLGEEVEVTRDPEKVRLADKLILPGVGAFGSAMDNLRTFSLEESIREAVKRGAPMLGICLGLQLLFPTSEESPGAAGLSLLPGSIVRIPPAEGLKIPHMGWNSLRFPVKTRLFEGIPEESYVYFVHSFYLKTQDQPALAATTEYGVTIGAAVEQDNLFACQFHPEKSGRVGLRILKNFAEL